MATKDAKLKKFREFDYAGDSRWAAYMRSVELPAAADTEAVLTKLKAKWYKKNVDPTFDADWVTAAGPTPSRPTSSTAASAAPPPASSAPAGTASAPPQQQQRTSGAPPASAYTGPEGRTARQLLLMHVGLVLLGPFAMVQLLPYSRTAYTLFLRLAMAAAGYKIYARNGFPSVRPLSAAMAWAQRALPCAETFQLLTVLTFMAQPPMVLLAAPIWLAALYEAAPGAAALLQGGSLFDRYGKPLYQKLMAKQGDAKTLAAGSEVALGFMLAVMLLTPQRNILTLFFYWNTLKIKATIPDSAPYHRQVWRMLDGLTVQYRQKVPVLEQGITFAKRWFNNIPMQPRP